MAKSLNDILQRYSDVISGKLPASKIEPLTTGENPGVDYADKMKDGRDFVAMHTVEKHPDRNGNGDDVFKGSTTKAKMERHGHEPKPKDIQVYNKTQQVSEAKDNREYDYEGEMAVTKLKTICRHAEHLIDMMKPNTNLPEWVQSKIVKAEDYISTAHDYLMSEMNEEVEEIDEGGSQYRSAAGSGKNTNPNLSRLARKLAFEKPKSFRPPGEKSKAENRDILNAEVAKFMKKGGKIRKEEVEELDERVKENKIKKNVAIAKIGAKARKANDPMHLDVMGTGIRQDVADKIRGRELSSGRNRREVKEEDELAEAKCNMTEAGKMCEIHGMKACAKEETKPSDEQPMYNGKKKKGKQLILDKELEEMATSQAQQKLMAIAYRYKQDPNSMPDASEQVKKLASTMTKKQLHDYAATKRKGLPDKVEESLADQRSSRSTASEIAREKITAALEKRKLAKEQSAPAETVIRMPSGEVGDTGRV